MSTTLARLTVVQGATFRQTIACSLADVGIPNIQAWAAGFNSFELSHGQLGDSDYEFVCFGDVIITGNNVTIEIDESVTASIGQRTGVFVVEVSDGSDRWAVAFGRWALQRGVDSPQDSTSTMSPPIGSGDGPTISNLGVVAGNQFAFMHIGSNGVGLGGRYKIDGALDQVDLRLLVPVGATPSVVDLYYETFGAPTTAKLRICPPQSGDWYQPDFTGIVDINFTPQAAGAPGWHSITVPAPAQIALVASRPVHLVIDAVAGFDPANYIEIISARSRFPLHYQPGTPWAPQRCRSIPDRWLQVLFSTNSADPGALLEERALNAHYFPIACISAVDGRVWGNPYDQHNGLLEASCHKVFGANCYGQRFSVERRSRCNYLGVYARGAGVNANVDPAGDLLIRLYEIVGGSHTLVATCVGALKTDRTFIDRSHWFGGWLSTTIDLKPKSQAEYYILAAAPGCTGGPPAEDAWLVGSDYSTNASLRFAGNSERVGYAVQSLDGGVTVTAMPAGVDADTSFLALHLPSQTSLGINDEVVLCERAGAPGVFTNQALAGEAVTLTVLARNIGLRTDVGGTLFLRLRNADTNVIISTVAYPFINQRNETAVSAGATMPASGDLHLAIEIGHEAVPGEGSATMVLDDVCYMTIREL